MKKLFTFTAVLLIAVTLMGQAPASFKYQAVLRDARGNIKANTATHIIFNILQGSATGTAVYSETHSVTTDGYGLINLALGKGTATNGALSAINWGIGTYFVKISVDGVEMGTDQLLSVPYALHAKTAEIITGGISEADPIFVAWNKSTGISIPASQIIDFQTKVTNNAAVLANTAKNSYPSADAAKLAAITGKNTGDQDLSGKVDKVTGKGLSTNDYTTAEKTKLATITGDQDLSGKVDKVTGKGLSTNDYTTAEQTKLAGIATGAEVNVNADWSAVSGDAQILNKPTITGTNTGDQDLSGKEDKTNKITSISGTSTDLQYPSAKLIYDQLALKVDKVAGKGLSTNDYTTAEQTKVSNLSGTNTGDQTLAGLGGVASNTTITGATKTKITYDAKGLVTAGADATTADIAASTNKNYVTDAQQTVINNTSGTNTGDNATNTQYSGLVSNATHTGDVTGATALTITDKAVTLAKMNDMATGSLIYRKTASTGVPEVQPLATLKTDLGLTGTNSGDQTSIVGITGTIAQFNTAITDGDLATGGGTATGTNTGDNAVNTTYSGLVSNVTHTGDVTGATVLTITDKAVTLAKMNDMATGSLIYRKTASTGVPEVQPLATLKTDLGLTGTNSGDQTLAGLGGVASNTAITGATKTKITYDAKGLVTAGADATTADIAASTNKNYVTDAQQTVINNTSGTNTGDNATNTQYSGLVSNATHTGDVTGATALTITDKAVTLAKMNDMATGSLIYRKTASTGVPEVQPLATLKTDLGLTGTNSGDQTSIVGITGTIAQFNTAITDGDLATGGGTATGTNTGDNAVNTTYSGLVSNATHTGDVTGSGALTIANKVTMIATAPVSITGSPTVIASNPVAISITAATTSAAGSMSASDKTKLDGYAKHTIGEVYGGGIVFYVYDGGQHGLIAATVDQSTAIRWYAGTSTYTMAKAVGVGAGKANTAIIIANQGNGDGSTYAARICNEYSVTVGDVTYGDWYLPSKFELNLLNLQKTVVDTAYDWYWSSTEDSDTNAWAQGLWGGSIPESAWKGNIATFHVRAVRAF
ncbi:MAG: hypothetical protein WC854_05220 [Bacteroidales bacterium]